MSRARVLLLPKMLQQIITTGFAVDRLECLAGVPQGAALVHVGLPTDPYHGGYIELTFQHDSFAPCAPGAVPLIDITMHEKVPPSEDHPMRRPPQPSTQDCSNHARSEWEGQKCMALWYPQMGGYVGRAVAVNQMHSDGEPGCIDVYVWHDGEFPFDEEDEFGRGHARRIHHCMADQFVEFGERLQEFQDSLATEPAK